MILIPLGVLVFMLAAALDFADARHKIAVENRDGHRAGLWSVSMYLLGIVGTLSVLRVSTWLVAPEAVGLYMGTRIAFARARVRPPVKP